MNKPMTSNSKRATAMQCVLLSMLLLLTACDGGIFGTGGGPDMIPPTDTDDIADGGTAPSMSETGDAAATSGNNTEGAVTGGGTTGGTAGTEGSVTGGTEQEMPAPVGTVSDDNNQFTNDNPVLSTAQARLNVVNASNLTINVFESSVEPDSVLFESAGLAPQSLSAAVSLANNQTSLDVVNNDSLSELLGNYTQFDVVDSSLSTVFVRQLDSMFFLTAAATQVSTSDASLVKVRMIQGNELGDALANGQFTLLAANTNSGGVDAIFGQINFFAPPTSYLEIPAGDYEFVDGLSRKDSEVLSFEGGKVYTITVVGPGATPSLISDDTALGN